jgi:hypothetical protein
MISIAIAALCLCLLAGIGLFIYNAGHDYQISSNFISVPLNFNPEDSSSVYNMNNMQITVYGGFVKGIQKDKSGTESLIIRALSPLPSIFVKSDAAGDVSLLLENINPDYYAKRIEQNHLTTIKTKVNTLKIDLAAQANTTIKVEPLQPGSTDPADQNKYIILGDNRDGYDTFKQIIQQINSESPVFVIDNGDLVFSGKPNQYRLFDQMASTIQSTLCTTLGNHDMRGNGRSTYTKLYGPAYYSFDFSDSHFIFLDSAPGWSEKQAISDEQYRWLEKDLIKAQGKLIFVITHIPPEDPRGAVTANEIPNYVNEVKSGQNWAEQKLNDYSSSKSMSHGFQDPQEAAKFEKLMSQYHVNTVYLSHIHSYLEYTKDGVRYLITGGAGAELLTTNSYYHYMISKIGNADTTTIVELPSPVNHYLTRYAAAAQLFANALYTENPVSVVLIILGLALLVILLIMKLYLWKRQPIKTLWIWLRDIFSFAVKRFKVLFNKKNTK